MPLINWSDKFSVGVKSLDSQHINLFKILNELHDSMKSGNDQSTVTPLLHKLLTYAREHFAEEEKLLQQVKYPGLGRQRAQHHAITIRVVEFLSRYKTDQKAFTFELILFLSDWLRKHILREDKEYSAWVSRRCAA